MSFKDINDVRPTSSIPVNTIYFDTFKYFPLICLMFEAIMHTYLAVPSHKMSFLIRQLPQHTKAF